MSMPKEKVKEEIKLSQEEMVAMVAYEAFLKRCQNKEIFDEEYTKQLKFLDDIYRDESKFPSKINLSDTENSTYDLFRLKYINEVLDFLINYYLPGKSPIIGVLNQVESEIFEGMKLLNVRRLIEHIASTIFHLSGALRAKYKHLLMPAPFTWETFEQLGGIMIPAPPIWQYFLVGGISWEKIKRFVDEINAVELIVEIAIPTILQNDVPILKELFLHIYSCEKSSQISQPKFLPVHLIGIKALTRRVFDIENLNKLLTNSCKYYFELDQRKITSQLKKKGKEDQLYMIRLDDSVNFFKRVFNLNTKLGRHAALRRLEFIGELITGKNFSLFLKQCNLTIDWQAFITVRDGIAHQDERENKAVIDELLKDTSLFELMLNDEMSYFFKQLNEVVSVRDETLPQFNKEELENFWQSVYLYEERNQKEPFEQENKIKAEQDQARASKEEEQVFMEALKSVSAPMDIQGKWLSILNGKESIPNKKDYGELLKYLPKKKENKELYEKCKKIADKIVNPKTDLESREEARRKDKEQALQRERDQQMIFKGLDSLRGLARRFDPDNFSGHGLTRQERVEAAITALENIKEFMEKEDFVKANFDFKDIQEWGKAQNQDMVLNFYARLVTNPEFNDAIEYNASQLLQHLDTIRKYPEAVGCKILNENYDTFRYLRNYIEHGNALLDKDEYKPGEEEDILSFRKRNVAPVMTTLIFELLPFLKFMSVKVEDSEKLKKERIKILEKIASPEWFIHNCAIGDVENIRILFRINKSFLLAKDSSQSTALMHAVTGGHVSTVKFLLEFETSINDQDQYGNTALIIAIKKLNSLYKNQEHYKNKVVYKEKVEEIKKIVSLLINKGADPFSSNLSKKNILFILRENDVLGLTVRKLDGEPEQYEIDVPSDGTCLFYSVTFAFLIPVADNPEHFKERFIKLFGKEVGDSAEENRRRFLNYNGSEAFIKDNAYALEVLVNVNFRKNVVNYMLNHKKELAEFINIETQTFEERMKLMGDSGYREWGDQPEIEAISRLLDICINVYNAQNEVLVPVAGAQHGQDRGNKIFLVHTAVSELAGFKKANIKNHYHYLIEKQYITRTLPKLPNLETSSFLLVPGYKGTIPKKPPQSSPGAPPHVPSSKNHVTIGN